MIETYATVHNVHERAVFEAIAVNKLDYPGMAGRTELLADVACVALNAMPARYVRHDVDLSFYQTDSERELAATAVQDAVRHAFEFVQARTAMRAR